MFTCSSCGYEANPDSAPACSLCGFKKAGKAAPAPKTTAALKADLRAAADDDLASLTKAVADGDDSVPAKPAKASGVGKPASASGVAKAPRGADPASGIQVTSQGTIRREEAPALLGSTTAIIGTFVGSLLGYVIQLKFGGHAPASSAEVLPALGGAIVVGLIFWIVVTPVLENTLSKSAREKFQWQGSVAAGLLFALFGVTAFVVAWRSNRRPDDGSTGPVNVTAVGVPGDLMATRLCLLTPWNLRIKTDKFFVCSNKGPELRIPVGPLTSKDVDQIIHATGFTTEYLGALASPEPFRRGVKLPQDFTKDLFLDRCRSYFGVVPDTRPKRVPDGRTALTRRRRDGQNEPLSMVNTPGTVDDLATAVPAGVPSWIGVAMGLPHDTNTEEEQLFDGVIDQIRPEN